MRLGLTIPIILSVAISLYPFLSNGAPFIGDSWIHIGYAREIYLKGRYPFGEYNLQWPYVNLIILIYKMLTGYDFVSSSQVIPFMAGLAIIPIYLLFKYFNLNYLESKISLYIYIFFPLFPIAILVSAVMKETSAYYIFNLLLIYILFLWRDPRKFSNIVYVLLSLSLILSHHFASLVMVFVITSLLSLLIYRRLSKNEGTDVRSLLSIFAFYSIIFLAWNTYVVLSIGTFFVRSLYQGILVISFIVITLFLVVRRSVTLLLGSLIVLFVYLGFRGGIYNLLTIEPPMTIGEYLFLFLFTIVYVLGLYRLRDSTLYQGVYTGLLTMFYVFLIWSPGVDGFVTFTKASHYIPIMVAPAIAVSSRYLNGLLIRRVFSIFIVAIFLIISLYSLYFVSIGLSAYTSSEVDSIGNMVDLLPRNISLNVDVRGGYLLKYFFNISVGRLGSRGFNLVFDVNVERGILLGYEWTGLDILVSDSDITFSDRLFDSGIIMLLYLR